jgi:hypothetical protein
MLSKCVAHSCDSVAILKRKGKVLTCYGVASASPIGITIATVQSYYSKNY